MKDFDHQKKSKIVIFTAHFPFGALHAEPFVESEIRSLSEVFKEVIIVSGERYNTQRRCELPCNINAYRVDRSYKKFQCGIWALLKMLSLDTLKEINYARKVLSHSLTFKLLKQIFLYYAVSQRNILWLKHNGFLEDKSKALFYSYWLATGAYTLARLKKNKIKILALSRAHGGDAFLDRGYQPFRKLIYQYLDEIHFIADTSRTQFEQKIKIPEDQKKAELFTSRLGSIKNTSKLNPARVNKEFFTIVSCSNIIPLKRLDLIIEAISYCSNLKINWIHFGEGHLKHEIISLAQTKLNSSLVTYTFKGSVHSSVIHDFYSNYPVDLFINTSDYEGIPVSIMEAMSYGIPVIARNVGGNVEIVFDEKNGILLSQQVDGKTIASAIKKIINFSEIEINQIRQEAYKTWTERYNAKDNNLLFCNHLINLIN